MNIKIINPLDFPSWDKLLLTNKEASLFHSSLWARVLVEAYRFKPCWFTIYDKEKLLLSIPMMEIDSFLTGKRGVSLPFTDRCEPVILSPVNKDAAWQFLKDYGKDAGWRYIEIRGGNGFGQATHPSSCYYEHILDLSKGSKEIYTHFRSSHKRNIKKAVYAGLEVSTDESLDGMKDFFRLHCKTRRMHGLPPQPFAFFQKIHENIIRKGHGLLLITKHQGNAIAAGIFFHFNRKALFKFGASDNKYQLLRANNLFMWKALEWYLDNGYNSFSFGRTDAHHAGLRHFKAGWGAEETKINYFRYDLENRTFVTSQSNIEGVHTALLRKLPILLLKVIGTIFYKHIG